MKKSANPVWRVVLCTIMLLASSVYGAAYGQSLSKKIRTDGSKLTNVSQFRAGTISLTGVFGTLSRIYDDGRTETNDYEIPLGTPWQFEGSWNATTFSASWDFQEQPTVYRKGSMSVVVNANYTQVISFEFNDERTFSGINPEIWTGTMSGGGIPLNNIFNDEYTFGFRASY